MKRTYLYRVYQHNKKLFVILLSGILGTAACNLTGVEITPFFVWGMYSEKEKPVEQYELLQTTVNDSVVLDVNDLWANDTRFYLTGPVEFYRRMKEDQKDPTVAFLASKGIDAPVPVFNTNTNGFMSWYARYLQSAIGKPVQSLRLDLVRLHFEGGQLVHDTTYFFDAWKKP